MINPSQLQQRTQDLPARHIEKSGELYLSRYLLQFNAQLEDGPADLWLHNIRKPDDIDCLHNHAWRADVILLNGGYMEEVAAHDGAIGTVARLAPQYQQASEPDLNRMATLAYRSIARAQGSCHTIGPFHSHRIVDVEPDTWTLLVVRPERLPCWYFYNRTGDIQKQMPSQGRYWWAPDSKQ